MTTPKLEIMLYIAVSETGMVDTYPKQASFSQLTAEQWIQKKREDSRLWHLKTIKTHVDMPVSYEVIE